MGLLSVYFTAPDDQAAEATIDWLGGPDVKDEQAGVEPYQSAEIPFDPAEQMTWVADMKDDPTGACAPEDCGRLIAVRDEGERVVLRLSKAARDALALAAVDPEAAQDTGVFEGFVDVEELCEEGESLIELAQAAQDKDWPLYLWLCV